MSSLNQNPIEMVDGAAVHEAAADSGEMMRIRGRLSALNGKRYWRSLEELADSPEFVEMLHREFPQGASEWFDPVSRRQFMTLMGASLALAGLTGCVRGPKENILPYVKQPENLIPGKPMFYATAMPFDGYALGLLAESHTNRPTKIEGNPEHPASLGGTNAFAQASILDLYDPDRAKNLLHLGEIAPWNEFVAQMAPIIAAQKATGGTGFRILTGTVTSPTLASQIEDLKKQFPGVRWHKYEPVTRDNVREGAKRAFGEYAETRYKFEDAEVVLSLEADFMVSGPGAQRYAREFARKRKVRSEKDTMARLYIAEAMPSNTGVLSDHRLIMKSG
ncbi:MAG: TAT-variant-translocated molybdopterin oxidoreductase, partial [Candidatus Sumerlaeaceae bacterium]|nr:TAT-variant-translocated molybdopterin oxidoreductase [Candidatus Sumerlaeaceae bacterium]